MNGSKDSKVSKTFSTILRHIKSIRHIVRYHVDSHRTASSTSVYLKSVIDIGIYTQDISFIYMMLIGNIVLLLSITLSNVLRDWVLLHVSTRVNISLISDYLIKLMKLPVTFFENKLVGDILQRAGDHERIRSFVMNNSLGMFFSIITFVVFSIILLIYNPMIFLFL